MSLLSIDVGIKNLALCLMDPSTRKIKHWDVSGVPPQHASGLFVSMRNHLRGKPWTLDSSVVLIEKQPDKNKGIKAIEHFLHAYFLCTDDSEREVIIYDARHKVPDVAGAGRARYLQRKKTSIERCRRFLEETQPEWLEVFDKHKKKDDLADTCMQALSFLNRDGVIPQLAPPVKPKPRKPTENQKITRYSKANLAWLYIQGLHMRKVRGHTEPQLDPRFQRDLSRYYHSLDELKSEFCL